MQSDPGRPPSIPPSAPVNMTASVMVPAGASTGTYTVTMQATSVEFAPATLSTSFTLNVTSNPDFILAESSAFPEVNAGSSGSTGRLSITSQDGFSGTVTLSCPNTYRSGQLQHQPNFGELISGDCNAYHQRNSFTAGAYSLSWRGLWGRRCSRSTVPFNVGDYSHHGDAASTATAGRTGDGQVDADFNSFLSGKINATCDASALSGAQCVLSRVAR